METITDKTIALAKIGGTSLKGYLKGVRYYELVQLFGEPTFDEASGDEKVQVEWVVRYNENYFTIYDWKTYNREYAINELTTWNIGGKFHSMDFEEAVMEKLQEIRWQNDLEQEKAFLFI